MAAVIVAGDRGQGAKPDQGLVHRSEVTDPRRAAPSRMAFCTGRGPVPDPEDGVQPHHSADGRTHVALNHNHKSPREDLKAEGLTLLTKRDAKVLPRPGKALQARGRWHLLRLEAMTAIEQAPDLKGADGP